MSDTKQCEQCGGPIWGEPTSKVLRGKKHVFCSEFCYRLYFYKIPGFSWDDIQGKFYAQFDSVPDLNLREMAEEVNQWR
jgi:hypothetical protein